MSLDLTRTSSHYYRGTITAKDVPLTMAAWFRLGDTGAGGTNGALCLENNTGGGNGYRLFPRTTLMAAQAFDSGSNFRLASFNPSLSVDGVWRLIVGVFTSDTNRTVYMDDSSNTANNTDSANPGSCDTLTIGGLLIGSSAYYEGQIGPCAIWNGSFDAGEVDELGAGIPFDRVRPDRILNYYPNWRGLEGIDVVGGEHLTAFNTPGTSSLSPTIRGRGLLMPVTAAGGGGGGGPEHIWKRRTNHLRAWDVPPAVIEW